MNWHNNTWGKTVIDRALAYVNHEWYPTDKNVLHGIDSNNVYVDTPDITWMGKVLDCGWWEVDKINIGVPYSWGNASTIDEFNKGLLEGKYAGNVPEDKSRHRSTDCVGIDCSGLLTNCWAFTPKMSTRDIPRVANRIEKIEEIKQGDIFAKIGSHVMLFVEFTDKDRNTVIIVDSTRSIGKVSKRELKVYELINNGYEIYRNKELHY
jgi:hypothetical protein